MAVLMVVGGGLDVASLSGLCLVTAAAAPSQFYYQPTPVLLLLIAHPPNTEMFSS